jgi:hypothetical protein
MSETEKQLEILLDEPQQPEIQKTEEPVVLVEDEEGNVAEAADGLRDDDPTKVIKKLQKTLKKERKAREKAERNVQMAQYQVKAAYTEKSDSDKQLVASAIDRLKTDNEILTAHYAEAMQVGDYDKAAKIQANISQNSTKLVQMENGYQAMQQAPVVVPEMPKAPKSDDVLDQIIGSVSKDSARWLKANRDNLDSEKQIRRMFRAHEDAIDGGIVADTPAYFRFIEDRLGIGRKNEQREQDYVMSAASKPIKNAPPPPAPVERYSNNRPNVVRLTRAEADMASALGMTEKEYAVHKRELQKSGKLPN